MRLAKYYYYSRTIQRFAHQWGYAEGGDFGIRQSDYLNNFQLGLQLISNIYIIMHVFNTLYIYVFQERQRMSFFFL